MNNDSSNKTNSQDLPEAPLSIHIDGYYKGFHAGITIRKSDNEVIPAGKVIDVIESLIDKGFKPSWNDETNGKHVSDAKPLPSESTELACEHKLFSIVESKSEKNPGRLFKKCNNCKEFLGWQT